jgi:dTDP-4-dehydrorhamnose 3,5-epimerase
MARSTTNVQGAATASSLAKDTRLLERLETHLPDVFQLRPKVFCDGRGFFIETYNRKRLADFGIAEHFVQDNQSCSTKDTLRGLHYQLKRPQAKLCRVVEGVALDVVVDIRVGSPDFGKWTSLVLSGETQNQVYIPAGFAHGFLALTDMVQFLYKCSDFYDPADEHGILWNDPDLKISWGIDAPIVSSKDANLSPLAGIPREFLPLYPSR